MAVDRRAVLAAVADKLWPGFTGFIELHCNGEGVQNVKEVVTYRVEHRRGDADLVEALVTAVRAQQKGDK